MLIISFLFVFTFVGFGVHDAYADHANDKVRKLMNLYRE